MQGIISKIERLREAKKVSKTQLADRIGVARETLYNITDENLKLSLLQKICEALETDVVQFLSHKVPDRPKLYKVEDAEVLYQQKASADCVKALAENSVLRTQWREDRETIKALNNAIEALLEKKRKG